jgi:hypothetical protein
MAVRFDKVVDVGFGLAGVDSEDVRVELEAEDMIVVV